MQPRHPVINDNSGHTSSLLTVAACTHTHTYTHAPCTLWLRPRPRYSSLIRPLLRAAAMTRCSPPRFTSPPAHEPGTHTHATTFNNSSRAVSCRRYIRIIVLSNRLGNSFINYLGVHHHITLQRNVTFLLFRLRRFTIGSTNDYNTISLVWSIL